MSCTTEVHRNIFVSRWAQKGLAFVGKRYIPQISAPDGVTLLFLHCAGSHKEAWEPTIEYLFNTVKDATSTGGPLIREAWSFDMPNHGESAALNEDVLNEGKAGLTVEECGEGLKAFVATGALKGHTLIGVGHSLGPSALVLSTVSGDLPGIKYKEIVLIEPALITREVFTENLAEREGALKAMNIAVSKRKDEWKTRVDARVYFENRFPWQMWDTRVFELFVQYGLREVTIQEDGLMSTNVRLCCDKDHERRSYVQDEVYYDVVERIKSIEPSVKIHYVYGERFDLVPEYVHESVVNVRRPASIQKVPNAGHFVLQENPDGLGAALARILHGTAHLISKL